MNESNRVNPSILVNFISFFQKHNGDNDQQCFSCFLIKLIHGDSGVPAMNLAQLQRANFRIILNSSDSRNECAHSINIALIE
jgi:hypothetical protein